MHSRRDSHESAPHTRICSPLVECGVRRMCGCTTWAQRPTIPPHALSLPLPTPMCLTNRNPYPSNLHPQIQRVRELAGLMPSTPSRDTMPSHPGRRPAPKGIVEPSGRSTANTAEEKYGSSLSSPSTVSLRGPAIELPPEFMREKSEVATGAARAASSMLMRSFKGRGWQGTLAVSIPLSRSSTRPARGCERMREDVRGCERMLLLTDTC